jgi:hypothetical protein
MKRLVITTVALASLSACASTPAAKSPAEMILGSWTCSAESEGVTTNAAVNYLKGGKATMDAKIAVNQGGMALNVTGVGEGSWEFLSDGKLRESVTKMAVTGGKAGANDVPIAMIQPMMDQMVVNQSTTSTAVITPTTMTSTDENGVVTSCKR